MTIQLIGAGLPRTGTSSLREALKGLLGAPVYHMSEAFARPEHANTWVRAMAGDVPVWGEFLAGYAAGVDAPFSNCWRDLARSYPNAPVLLSRRSSPAEWLRSMEATVIPRAREMLAKDNDDPMVPLFRAIFPDLCAEPINRAAMMNDYERWLDDVRAEIPPSRLVEWQPSDGWAPICQALALPIPARAFPHENSTADHRARHEIRVHNDALRLASVRREAGE